MAQALSPQDLCRLLHRTAPRRHGVRQCGNWPGPDRTGAPPAL